MRDVTQLAKVVQRLLRKNAYARVGRVLEREHPADIPSVLRLLRHSEVSALFTHVMSAELAGEVLEELDENELSSMLASVTADRLTELIQVMDPASAVKLLDEIPKKQRDDVLNHLEPQTRNTLERIFSFPEGTAGRAASPVKFTIGANLTVQGTIATLREAGTEDIWDLYVVDPSGQLMGIVPMRRLLVAQPDTMVRDLLVEVPVAIDSLESVEEAARACAKYDLMAVPVVDEHHNLIGIITVDDVLDIVEEVGTEAMYGIAGLDRHLRVDSPILEHLSTRWPWVFVNLVTATLAAVVVGAFEATIAEAAFLAAFMPVVAGMGGNMGTQTLTLVTRGLALGEVGPGSVRGIILRQLAVGLVLGIAVGSLMGLGAWLWQDNVYLSLAVFLAIIVNFLLGALIGIVVPFVFQAFDRDPAVGSGVIVTATTDILGFLQFLFLASFLLGLL
jgi:magnesium transporter